MSSFVFNKAAQLIAAGQLDLDAAGTVIRALLERSTSTYVPDRDHDFLDDFTGGGGVEISVASYARQTLATKAVNLDNANDRAEFDADNPAWATLESGQTVKALILYQQVGGDDTTPADDVLLMRYDGTVDIVLAANAAQNATTIYCDPLPAALATGTALDFGGGATCTLNGAAALGARSVTVTALAAAAVAGTISSNVPVSGNILPFVLGGGAFNVTIDAEGLIQFKPR